MEDIRNSEPLSRKLKKKYAMANQKFELGIWGSGIKGYDIRLIKGINLTTYDKAVQTQGKYVGLSKNSWKFMVGDLRKLNYMLNKMGMKHESCFAPELTPEAHEIKGRMTVGGLLHLHGFMRFEECYGRDYLAGLLSELWGKIHDSPIVYVKDLWSAEGAKKYSVKDAVKNYVRSESFSGRILCSKGWLPVGWKIVNKVLVRWLIEHRYPNWVNEDSMGEFVENNPEVLSELVWMAKDIMQDYMYRWCCGEAIKLDFDGGSTFIQGLQIYESMGGING